MWRQTLKPENGFGPYARRAIVSHVTLRVLVGRLWLDVSPVPTLDGNKCGVNALADRNDPSTRWSKKY